MRKRNLALDIFRGMTICLMIIVNNPGNGAERFSILRHCPWDGCTPTDLVFPFFLFCAGCAMAYSLAKFDSLSKDASLKILKRTGAIFLVGLMLNMFPFYPTKWNPELTAAQNWGHWISHIRILGVLQRIALSYALAAFITLAFKKKRAAVLGSVGVLCALHFGILMLFGDKGAQLELGHTVAERIDIAIFGENHVYHGYGVPFDPEGLLGVLTGACNALLGFLIGSMTRRYAEEDLAGEHPEKNVAATFFWGCVSLATAMTLSIWIPINKPLWSASYVFFTCGWGMIVLAFWSYIVDVLKVDKPLMPLKAFGMNALAMFALSGMTARIIGSVLKWNKAPIFDTPMLSLTYAVIFMLVHWCVAYILYRKRIVIIL